MRLTVLTYGSDGDTRPFAALSRGLLDAGHEVQLLGERSSLSIAHALGVPAEPLAGDVRSILPRGEWHETLSMGEVIASGRGLLRLVADHSEQWLRTVSDHARHCDAILFSGLAMFAGVAAGLELGKPHIGLWALPITPTREFSSPMMPPLVLGSWANRLSFRALSATLWRYYGQPANAARVQVFGGGPRAKLALDVPILYGISPQLVPQPSDWPATHQICGHWSAAPQSVPVAPELLEFLAAGAPPIYVGFGSVSGYLRRPRLQVIIDAVAGRRAVFYPGWSRIDATMLPKNFCVVGETTHDWLFPRCSVVIHHGGAGTTHTAARSGVPSIVLPFGADQFFWASRLVRAGVAPPYLRLAKSDARTLATMLEFTQREEVRARAKALGAAMAREDGVGTAVARIEALLLRAPEEGTDPGAQVQCRV